jgi:hypothetical protein
MSSTHIEAMLKSLTDYKESKISLTFTNDHKIDVCSVCYLNNGFEVTYLINQTLETHKDIESTISAIEHSIKLSLPQSSSQ